MLHSHRSFTTSPDMDTGYRLHRTSLHVKDRIYFMSLYKYGIV